MKKLFTILSITLFAIALAHAGDDKTLRQRKDEIKAQTEQAKTSGAKLAKKLSKEAKKQAKVLSKEGWQTAPGAPEMEEQLLELLTRQYDRQGGMPAYIIGRSTAKSSSMGLARKQAETRARADIAAQIEAEFSELIETTDTNIELSNGEVETMGKIVATSRQLINQKLGRTEVVMELYRTVDGHTIYQMAVSYDGNMAKSDLRAAFEKESAELRAKLDQLMKQ